MKNFWPNRGKAKGFSIQNLARKNGLKISNVSPRRTSDQLLDDRNLLSIRDDTKKVSVINLSIKKTHWANRDFSEYKEVA